MPVHAYELSHMLLPQPGMPLPHLPPRKYPLVLQDQLLESSSLTAQVRVTACSSLTLTALNLFLHGKDFLKRRRWEEGGY